MNAPQYQAIIDLIEADVNARSYYVQVGNISYNTMDYVIDLQQLGGIDILVCVKRDKQTSITYVPLKSVSSITQNGKFSIPSTTVPKP